MDLVYMWCSIGVVFLIVEFFTITTYGLGLGIASFIVATYVGLSGIEEFELTQFLVMFVATIPLVLTFPRFLSGNIADTAIWPDIYIWKTSELFKNGNVWKIKFDWVEYPVVAKDKRWFRNGKEVKALSQDGWVFTVEKN